ncbi:regulator of G-protein signaling Rgs1 [Schizosaccharomyces osmophilus]|uniref:Regulator of G-protein signaling Rgs1 n=1 Tax=Schizosaccharomyces osmophilus TaxID=2545709 RepID=A0AAE9W5V5_9SCHI|nr:regulator of G-protein signaling Rgs1 [Schizosaccharomyces osmophilus]WBW70710.1 regulator of G-protein signaling Rgs1 [Schizosaccharomyces osmophilus]
MCSMVEPHTPPPCYDSITAANAHRASGVDWGLHDRRQHCSRFMKMTSYGRPFSKDFLELYSAMVISTPFSKNRSRFRTIDSSCTLLQLFNTLENLELSQMNRLKGNTGNKLLKSTTKFTVPKKAAKCLCEMFLNARLLQVVHNPMAKKFTTEKCVLQLTDKGISVVARFLHHNGDDSINANVSLPSNDSSPVIIPVSRFSSTDQVLQDASFPEMLLQRMLGPSPKCMRSRNESLVPIYLSTIHGKKRPPHATKYLLFGIDIAEWLMNHTMLLDWNEVVSVANNLLLYSYLAHTQTTSDPYSFSFEKGVSYYLTPKALETVGWIENPSGASIIQHIQQLDSHSSNKELLESILKKPSLQTYFFEFLKKNFCDENQQFYSEVCEFNDFFSQASQANDIIAVRESFVHACGIYNCFLSPAAPNAVNLPSDLYERISNHMSLAMEVEPLDEWLRIVHKLFLEAQALILDLMAGDSLLKFLESHHPDDQ